MAHLYVILFAGLAVCIEAGLSILRTPNRDAADGDEAEQFDRLPPAF
ncbi:hypothetical protein GALL_523450 [mine drainage metagenome]|uniref:Uncharacterized protein n=1 Tax=mine drainage metagenome TaxID=410659 RepID=A0A1J5P3H9_9ZZZZ